MTKTKPKKPAKLTKREVLMRASLQRSAEKNGNIATVAHHAPALRDPLYSKAKLYSNGRKARMVSGGAPSLGKRKK